jgi:hypothetical protein
MSNLEVAAAVIGGAFDATVLVLCCAALIATCARRRRRTPRLILTTVRPMTDPCPLCSDLKAILIWPESTQRPIAIVISERRVFTADLAVHTMTRNEINALHCKIMSGLYCATWSDCHVTVTNY